MTQTHFSLNPKLLCEK